MMMISKRVLPFMILQIQVFRKGAKKAVPVRVLVFWYFVRYFDGHSDCTPLRCSICRVYRRREVFKYLGGLLLHILPKGRRWREHQSMLCHNMPIDDDQTKSDFVKICSRSRSIMTLTSIYLDLSINIYGLFQSTSNS